MILRFYSQQGEDFLVNEIFRDLDRGCFVEIGCIDGRRFSNTLALEQRGWGGLCVEAHPDYIDLLNANRPGSVVAHCAVGERDQADVTFYTNSRGSLSTLDARLEGYFRENYAAFFSGFEPRTVPMRTVSSLLDEYGLAAVDVMSIDIEGGEVDALRGIDFARHRPRLIITECLTDKERHAVEQVLLPAGYVRGFKLSSNWFYTTEPELLNRVVGRKFQVELTITEHPLDDSGDQQATVNIDLSEFSAHTRQAESDQSSGRGDDFQGDGEHPAAGDLASLLKRCKRYDPRAHAVGEWLGLDASLAGLSQDEIARLDAGLDYDARDPWVRYVRALAYETNGQYQAALDIFKSVVQEIGQDWRVMFHLAICADATRQAANMALAEHLHWQIQELRPDFEPSRRFIPETTKQYAFHGDPQYQAVVKALLDQPGASAFIETGTFLGRSTAFVAGHKPQLDIFTAEINEEYFQLAKQRLQGFSNVSQHLLHSVDLLTKIVAEKNQVGDLPVFFLDAHWQEDWPLLRELDIIRRHCARAVIVIDDFQVPGHPQFPYDDYGDGKTCALDTVLGQLPGSVRRHNLFPRYSREQVPSYISLAGYGVFFVNAEDAYRSVARLQHIKDFFFTYDVDAKRHVALDFEDSGSGPAGAAGERPGPNQPSAADVTGFAAAPDAPFLVSFPRTGSHWLRMALELYFDRPLLTRTFFDHDESSEFLLSHSHDMDLNLVRQNVLYICRDPVDTIFSQLNYHGEDCFSAERVHYWADLYGQHAHKWIVTEGFTRRKTLLRYEVLRSEPVAEMARAIEHLGGTVEPERVREVLAHLDKQAVRSRTQHDPKVVADQADYERHRKAFRERMGEIVWSHFLRNRAALAQYFGQQPYPHDPDYHPERHPRQPWEYKKIIGLVPGKNEASKIEFCIRALAQYCDSIVYFDDDSSDDSVAIVESIAEECRVERIIRKTDDVFHESIRRVLPLQAGRELGGTHFIVIDADEAFTANCMDGDFLRRAILALEPGDSLELVWIQLWRSLFKYRRDGSVWTDNYKAFVFADDGQCRYDETFIHLGRVPSGLKGECHRIEGYEYGLMHFQFVNWRNLLVKQAWYRCLERINFPDKPAAAINALYGPSKDEHDLGLRDVPHAWFNGYPFVDAHRLERPDTWREGQVLEWFEQYRAEHFRELDIWDVDWGTGLGRDSLAPLPEAFGAVFEADRLVAEGEERFHAGDHEGALERFGQALERDADHTGALNNLGALWWEAGEPVQALTWFTRGLLRDPDNRELVINTGQALQSAGREADAAELYDGFLSRHPGDTEVQRRLEALGQPLGEAPGKDSRYLVTAIVSVYNAERYMRGCLEDLEAQTLAGQLQVIVIDSGSEQNERAIVEEFQRRYDNIEYVRTAERETIYAAWNRAIQRAQGKYLTNANADDRHRNDALQRMAEALEENPDVAVVYADTAVTYTENEAFDRSVPAAYFRWPEFDPRTMFQCCYVGPQPMWRRALHHRYGPFDAEFKSAGDYEFWLRLAANERFLHLSELLGLYLLSTAGVEHGNAARSAEESRIARERHWPVDWGVLPPAEGNFLVEARLPELQAGPDDGETPLVSVVIPTRNRRALLADALASVLAQDYPHWEAIVVNDGGEDVANLAAAADRAGRVRYLAHRRSRGQQAAKNTALRAARGEIICYLDDDDRFLPDHLSTVVAALRDSGAAFVYTEAELVDEQVEEGVRTELHRSRPYTHERYSKEKLYVRNYIPINTWAHRRACLARVGLFDETLESHEDWDLLLRVSREFDLVHVPKVTAEIRRRTATGDSVTDAAARDFHQIYRRIYRRYLDLDTETVRRGREQALAELPAQRTVDPRYAQAQRLIEQGLPEAAVLSLEEFVQDNPDEADAWNDLGALLTMLGQRDVAIQCLEKAAELDADNPSIARNLARFHESGGDIKAALEILKAFLERNPHSAEVVEEAKAVLTRVGGSSLVAQPRSPEPGSQSAMGNAEIQAGSIFGNAAPSTPGLEAESSADVARRDGKSADPAVSKSDGRKIKLAVYTFARRNSVDGHLRVYGPLTQYPEEVEVIPACSDDGETFFIDGRVLEDADLVLVQGQFASADPMQPHVDAILGSGKPVVVDLDELMDELFEAHDAWGTTNPRGLNLQNVLERAAAVTVPSPYLKEIYAGFAQNIHVLPNLLDSHMWPRPQRAGHKRTTIGVLADPKIGFDGALIEALFRHIADEYGDAVAFCVIGDDEALSGLPNCTYVPLKRDYDALARQLAQAQVDIAVVPLADTDLNRAAGNAQWLLWSAAGVAGIYADLSPYNTCVDDGVTGLLAGAMAPDWVDAVAALIDDPARREAMAAAARDKVFSEYAVAQHAGDFVRFYRGLVQAAGAGGSERPSASAWYAKWVERHLLTEADCNVIVQRLTAVDANYPAVHLMTTLRPGEEARLADTIDNLAGLLYQDWSLTVVSTLPAADPVFEELDRLQWVTVAAEEQVLPAVNEAAGKVAADWVAMLEPGDRFAPNMLFACAEHAARNPQWCAIYTDEDMLSAAGERFDPRFKPDFNLELLRSMPYTGGGCLIRRDSLRELGGFDAREGVHAHALLLRAVDRYGDGAIGHVADVLYHRHVANPARHDTRLVADNGRAVLLEHLGRNGIAAQVTEGFLPGSYFIDYEQQQRPKVSIIIPTKDRLDLIQPCVDGLLEKTTYPDYEVLVVDNGSREAGTLAYFDELQRRSERVRVLAYPHPYSFAAINNFAAEQAVGDYLVLLNNDTLIVQDNWLERMMAHGQRPEVGVVGARLVFPNGKLQHAGVYVGLSHVADHPMMQLPMQSPGYMGRAQVAQELSAVTAACLLIRKSIYAEVGGLDEERFRVLFNDVDLCLKVRERGYKVVWTPFATVIHYGSSSLKRAQKDPQVEERNRRENLAMVDKWLPVLARDPAFNRNISLHYLDLRPEVEVDVPWDGDIETRLKVVGFGFGSDGSWRHRVCSPLAELRAQGLAATSLMPKYRSRVRILSTVELERIKPDVLLMHNTVHDTHLKGIEHYRRHNKPFIVFGQDDLMSALPSKNPFSKTVYRDFKKRLRKCLQLSDRLLVTTEPLADEYRKFIDDIRIVPNYLERGRWGGLRSLRRQGRKPRVGWAGAPQHLGDLEVVADMVRETAGEIEWVFFGMCPAEIRPLVAEFHEPVPFTLYPEKLASLNLDLAIAPLEHNRFNEAKSNLRILEYGVLGIPVVCTDIHPYRDAPVERVANISRVWTAAIRERINDLDHAAREGERLQRWVRENWMLEDRLDDWLDALTPEVRQGMSRKVSGGEE